MKKRILIVLVLLLTTGCTCEYNLTINNGEFKENIIIENLTNNDISSLNKEWKIPVDKNEYDTIANSDSEDSFVTEIYNYKLLNNKINFNYDFNNNYMNSTAVLNCYDNFKVSTYDDSLVISTSLKNNCFDKYPPLENIIVNIIINEKVVSNNADSVKGNKYTWNINKDNASNKPINIIIKYNNTIQNSTPGNNSKLDTNKKSNKLSIDSIVLYVFLAVILIIILLGYNWFLKFKEKNNKLD